jgi:predicted dehydrogenase
MRPYSKNHFAYNWHWFRDTGNGDIGNQGIHEMDIARWGSDAGFQGGFSSGGKYVYDDDQETPNTQIATLDYGDAELVFEVRGLNTGGEYNLHGTSQGFVGNIFYGKKGFMSVDHVGFEIFLGDKFPQGGEEPQAHGP